MRAVARDPSVQLAPSASTVCRDLFTQQVWAPAQLAAVTKKSRARLLIWYSLLEHYSVPPLRILRGLGQLQSVA